jgi:ABC-2 type transport system permease protein
MNVIYILWLRQLKRSFRSKPRIVASMGQPLLFLLVFGSGFSSLFRRAGEGNYMQFLAPGVIAMSILFTSIFAGIEVIWDRQFGFLKETLVAPVPRLLIMLGRTMGGATVAVLQGLLVFILCLLVGFRPVTLALAPVALLYMLLTAILFTAVGTALGSVMPDFQAFQLVMNFLVMPIFFLSGALFPLTNVPRVLSLVAGLDPLSYSVDGIRSTLIGTAHFGGPLDLAVLCFVTAIILALGARVFSKIQV